MSEHLAYGAEPECRSAPLRATSHYFARKAWPTRLLGAALLIVASPVIVLLVLLVRATSAGPGLYRQLRTGKDGREFWMYKIRTMVQDAESVSGPTWCKPGDTRITPLGGWLRRLHLDELPQLINIVRGEMDLIGPRPERPSIVESLTREIPGYRDRLQVLPGVTGLAQINLPPDETVDCVRKKLVLDRDYIHSAGLSLDLRILACTALRMLGIHHGAARLFRLERMVTLPAESIGEREEVLVVRPAELVLAGANGRKVDYESAPAVTLSQTPRRPR